MDPITTFTLELWHKIIKNYGIKNEINLLKWVVSDTEFTPVHFDMGFKQWEKKGVTAWCTLEKDGKLESFQNIRDKYDLDAHDLYRYLLLRDYYRKTIRGDPSMEVNSMIQTVINVSKGKNFKAISKLYDNLTINKNTTNYIKEKWESELSIEISHNDWLNMCKIHQKSTGSRTWREFWKNLIGFFITPKVKSKYGNENQPCWRRCGSRNADHINVFWKCERTGVFWKTVHKTLREVLRYELPMCAEVLYLSDFKEEYVHGGDGHLLSILLTAGKKAITRKWGRVDPPDQNNG